MNLQSLEIFISQFTWNDMPSVERTLMMMILLQPIKKRREPGGKCHARTMTHRKPIKLST